MEFAEREFGPASSRP